MAILLLRSVTPPTQREDLMIQDAVRAAIDQHTCVMSGVRYQFTLKWCATEKYVDPRLARNLLYVECVATADGDTDSVPLQVLVWTSNLGQLPAILQDALHTQLAPHRMASNTESSHREIPRTPTQSNVRQADSVKPVRSLQD